MSAEVPERVAALWGAGTDAVLGSGSPLEVVAWPTWSRRRDRAPFDRDLVAEVLGGVPRLVDVDPRHLVATQPYVTWDGLAHYATPTYWRTGRTHADHASLANRFPLVYRRHGVPLILGGHHRATIALVTGRPLRSLVIDGPWGPVRDGHGESPPSGSSGDGHHVGIAPESGTGAAGAVTPSLLLGSWSPLPHVTVDDADRAASEVEAGGTALTDDTDVARSALAALGVDDGEAAARIQRARSGLTRAGLAGPSDPTGARPPNAGGPTGTEVDRPPA